MDIDLETLKILDTAINAIEEWRYQRFVIENHNLNSQFDKDTEKALVILERLKKDIQDEWDVRLEAIGTECKKGCTCSGCQLLV